MEVPWAAAGAYLDGRLPRSRLFAAHASYARSEIALRGRSRTIISQGGMREPGVILPSRAAGSGLPDPRGTRNNTHEVSR